LQTALAASDHAGAPAPAVLAPDVASRLAQLTSLRDQQLITDEEYQAKRVELLGQL